MKLRYFFGMLFLAGQVMAQKNLAISILPKTGFLIAHRAHMSHLVQDRNTAFELEFSQQDASRNYTSNAYRFPSRGFSLHYQDYGYKEVLGRSYSVLQFTQFNLIQHRKLGFLDLRIGSGIGYITKKYDAESNPKNNAIGSHWNAFVNFQLVYTQHFDHFLVGLGAEMSHFSNAAMTMPNLGLNTPMAFVKLGYCLDRREVFTPDTNAVVTLLPRRANKIQVHAIGSLKQNLPGYTASEYLPVLAFQGLYRHQLNFKWDLEIGFDFIYNAANRYKYDYQSYTFSQTLQFGVYGGAAANFYRSQIFFGLGGYCYNYINPAGYVYNRIGYRYNLSNSLNLMLAIKANYGIADYLEIGIGYRFL